MALVLGAPAGIASGMGIVLLGGGRAVAPAGVGPLLLVSDSRSFAPAGIVLASDSSSFAPAGITPLRPVSDRNAVAPAGVSPFLLSTSLPTYDQPLREDR